ncbi:MAG: SDR family NAD(P)-dependent oxidoreductase [Haloferacaceae archaeon]
MARTVVIAGVGPGLGESLARTFADAGYQLALLARSADYLDRLAADLPTEAVGVRTDLRDPEQIRDAFETLRGELAPVEVLVNHASGGSWRGIDDLDVEDFDRAYEVGVRGSAVCTRAALADMRDLGEGTVLFTGATSSVRGKEGAAAFSAAKFGVRGLAQSLAKELGPEGIHVAHVVLDGGIRPPNESVDEPAAYLDPDDVAERYLDLVEEDTATMTHELHVTNGAGGAIEFV